MMDEDIPAVVIDSGTGSCKAGFAGDDAPRCVFSSVVGTPRFRNEDITTDTFVGDEAQIVREFVSLKYPIQRGIVTHWEDAEKIWGFCFKDLCIESTEHPVLMSEPVFNPTGNRELMAEHMFEKFSVPKFFLHNSATLSLFNSGRGVGVVVDIGEGVTSVVPFYFGYSHSHTFCRQDFGGRDVTSYLQKLLLERGYSFTTTAEWEYVREIKESLSYASLDFAHDLSVQKKDTPFVLPDGNRFVIGKERFQCAECLFQPSLMYPYDKSLKGVHELLQSAVEMCDVDFRKDFYSNVILSGGTSMMQNFENRLQNLWSAILPPGLKSRIVAAPERKYSAWIGGSIMASMSTFQQAWITKADYEEFGPAVVHRRFM